MRLADVDTSATQGDSALHRAAPIPKLVGFGLGLAAVMVANDPLLLAAVALLLLAVWRGLGLPIRRMAPLAGYAGVFATLFAIATAGPPAAVALFVLKAIDAAALAVTLMFTTPYPYVFAPIQRVVPWVVGDALLMTYRSFFLLLGKLDNLVRSVRLRAGVRGNPPVRSAVALATALGSLALYSLDMSQRTYDVMRLRGYERRLKVSLPPSRSRAGDVAAVALPLAALATTTAWRANPARLAPADPAVLAGALLLLAIVLLVSSLADRRSA